MSSDVAPPSPCCVALRSVFYIYIYVYVCVLDCVLACLCFLSIFGWGGRVLSSFVLLCLSVLGLLFVLRWFVCVFVSPLFLLVRFCFFFLCLWCRVFVLCVFFSVCLCV